MSHVVQSQDEVLDFLGRPQDGVVPHRIDTHASAVFLWPDRALKIKRAVRFPFLDYSTLDRRKGACEAELAVNRPFAPEIYRGVVAITREHDGSLQIGGAGDPVEWAVDMRRFDENATLDRLAERGAIDAQLADTLGRLVARVQRTEEPVDAAPWIAALADYLDQNNCEFRETPDLFAEHEVAGLTRQSRAALERIRPLLVARGHDGLVRRGHGDLHLGNIVMIDERPVPFDAIEFDPLIATGDVLYELAFLLMDLVERGLAEAANITFNRYLTETRRDGDLDALAALPLFLSLRAAVRAKVTAARIEGAQIGSVQQIRRAARNYFDRAHCFLSPPPAQLIAVGGLSGTGKSLLARALAPQVGPAPGARVLRSDVERKAMLGKAETEKLPQDAYRPEITARLYHALADKATRALRAGHAVIVDAVCAHPQERSQIAAAARAASVSFAGLFLTADLATRLARVGGREKDASDADTQVARAQESYDLGAMDWIAIDASDTPEDTLKRARAALG
jgi:aminoglycoside phosphotransferase family enzyme/predicted kinase